MSKPELPKPTGDAAEAVRYMLIKAAIFILLPLFAAVVTAVVVLQ